MKLNAKKIYFYCNISEDIGDSPYKKNIESFDFT